MTRNAVVALLPSPGSGAIVEFLAGEISDEPFGTTVSWPRVLLGIVKSEVSNEVSEIGLEFAAPDRHPLELGHYALSWQGESDVVLKKGIPLRLVP